MKKLFWNIYFLVWEFFIIWRIWGFRQAVRHLKDPKYN